MISTSAPTTTAAVETPVVTESISSAPQTTTYASSTPTTIPTVVQSAPAVSNAGSAIAEANTLRIQRGLPPFIEDPSLSAVAYNKASIQANAGQMYHPGGSMGGARYEGVGMGQQFLTCYLYSNVGQYAGAATVVGRNGQRYHCLLVK